MLQDGIYHAPGQRPGDALMMVMLNCRAGQTRDQIGTALARLWAIYQSLTAGNVGDLPGHTLPTGNLSVLIGFGRSLFEKFTLEHPTPETLDLFGRFQQPLAAGGGRILGGGGISFAPEITANTGRADIVVQFIGDTELAVNRGLVETWKFLHDEEAAGGQAPFELADAFQGFQRDDHRSWIDFHDGVSNLRSDQREAVIAVKQDNAPISADQWTIGGTYMVFMRLRIDIRVWRQLERARQELIVGRDKLTGCPLIMDPADPTRLIPMPGCPVAGTSEVTEPGNEAFRETPPVNLASPIGQSHVHRANHHQDAPQIANSLRVFRQGFEFLERSDSPIGFELGLNFISFQDTSQRVFRMLTQPTWLGQTNFGGDPATTPTGMGSFLSAVAAGVFFVPPKADAAFPGSSLFGL